MNPAGVPVNRLCSKGCGRRAKRRGLCSAHYNQRRERDIAYGRWQSSYVDAQPAREHVLALRAAGLGKRPLSDISGVNLSVIHVLINGRPERGRPPSKRIAADNARRILAVPMPDTRLLAGGARIDPTGTTRRLRALVAIGYTQRDLAARLGITPENSTVLFYARRKVLAATARKVAKLYDELSMTAGPSSHARDRAKQRGWAPPLAWDDDTIDNPDAAPDLGAREHVDWAGRYREMRDLGYSDIEILHRWNMQPASMIRQMERHGLPWSPALATLAAQQKWRRATA